jgi:hypothetical protein
MRLLVHVTAWVACWTGGPELTLPRVYNSYACEPPCKVTARDGRRAVAYDRRGTEREDRYLFTSSLSIKQLSNLMIRRMTKAVSFIARQLYPYPVTCLLHFMHNYPRVHINTLPEPSLKHAFLWCEFSYYPVIVRQNPWTVFLFLRSSAQKSVGRCGTSTICKYFNHGNRNIIS